MFITYNISAAYIYSHQIYCLFNTYNGFPELITEDASINDENVIKYENENTYQLQISINRYHWCSQDACAELTAAQIYRT